MSMMSGVEERGGRPALCERARWGEVGIGEGEKLSDARTSVGRVRSGWRHGEGGRWEAGGVLSTEREGERAVELGDDEGEGERAADRYGRWVSRT